jgi:heme-degrading monooxygenase HmoA
MIVRVVAIEMKPGQEGLFHASLRHEIGVLRAQPGLVYVKAARRVLDTGGEEVVLVEEWATPQDLHAWAGPDLTRPRFLPDIAHRVEAATRRVEVIHYEAIDLEVDQLDGHQGTSAAASGPRPTGAGTP